MGRELELEKINEIGALSEKHGFVFDLFLSFERLISDENYERTRDAFTHRLR